MASTVAHEIHRAGFIEGVPMKGHGRMVPKATLCRPSVCAERHIDVSKSGSSIPRALNHPYVTAFEPGWPPTGANIGGNATDTGPIRPHLSGGIGRP